MWLGGCVPREARSSCFALLDVSAVEVSVIQVVGFKVYGLGLKV